VQVSDGTHTVVLWEAPDPDLSMGPHMQAATLTIRLCDPLNPVRRKEERSFRCRPIGKQLILYPPGRARFLVLFNE